MIAPSVGATITASVGASTASLDAMVAPVAGIKLTYKH